MRFTKRIEKELVLDALHFVAGIAIISLFYQNVPLLTFLLIAGFLSGIKFWYKRHDIYFYIAGAVLGPLGEMVAISFGAWQYALPTAFGIPLWLPFAWGNAMVLIKSVAETFSDIGRRK